MTISPARKSAFDILEKIENKQAFSSELLAYAGEQLGPKDRGLCHEIVLGVLRQKFLLDRIIDDFSGGKRLDSAVRTAARIGLYQAMFLDRVPRHSLVNESVNLTARAGKSSAKGFINALLRRAADRVPELDFRDDIDRVSTLTSYPRWLIERWSNAFGYDRAAAIASANNVQPPLAFRYTPRAEDRVRSDSVVESSYIAGCFLTGKATDELTEKAVRGEIYFQDEASQMLGAAVRLDTPGRIADICAAPGGKLTQIVSNHPDSSVVAVDISYARLEIMRRLLDLRGIEKVGIVQANAEDALPFDERSFDHVIVDAPCSGTGTIRHNPELRYFISEAAIGANQTKQLQILRQASKLVKSGGSLIYSTCSLEKDENEEVIRGFREEAADDFEPREPNVPARFLEGNGLARTFPDRDGLDGFFMASFRRR